MTLPLLFRVGDDWTIVASLGSDGGTGGGTGATAYNLTGATVTATLYAPAPAALSSGSVTVTDAPNGVVSVIVPQSLTIGVPPQTTAAKLYPCRLSLSVTDSLGRRHTFDPIPILPLQPQDDAPVPVGAQAVTLTVAAQGPAGPAGTGAGAAISIVSAEAISAGMPAYVDRVSKQLRSARADTYLACFVAGVVSTSTAIGFAATVLDGPVALADWTAATGAADLVPGLTYFVGASGGLTATPPTSVPGATIAAVGRATDARTLLVSPSNPIKL